MPVLPLPFLSATSANALISDLRPTTLTPSALQFINAILDELLVSIVTSARSINPAHFRTRGAPAVLADREDSLGALGRAAVGEAEVEIRSWYEGHPTANKRAGFPPGGEGIGLAGDAPTSAVFPIHEAVELMRLKAAMFSTFAPQTPPTDYMDDILDAWKHAGGDDSESTISPASLWLTAVLEHICEHILSKLSQVVARDSSVTAARIQDLYTALCEDDSVYTFFKKMGAKTQLEQAIKAAPHSSRSRSQRVTSISAPPRASPPALDSPYSSRTSLSTAPHGDHRKQASAHSTGSRPSSEQFYYKKGGSTVSPSTLGNGHKRGNSVLSLSSRHTGSAVGHDEPKQNRLSSDRSINDDFDALLRSGETMRVSLTPSRFSTFDTSPTTSPPRGEKQGHHGVHHLSAPSSSESSLLSSSTQASTVESARMGPSHRQVAGRSWQSTTKLMPRDATIEEKFEEEQAFGQSVMELLKTEQRPSTPQSIHLARTVPAVILGSPLQPAHADDDSPPAELPSSTLRGESEISLTPEPSLCEERSASIGGEAESVDGSTGSLRARPRPRVEPRDHDNRLSDTRALALFLKTPPIDPPNSTVDKFDDLPPAAKTKMSFKGIMNRMKKVSSTEKHLTPPSSSSTLRSSSSSVSAALRSQRSISSFGSNSTAIPSKLEDSNTSTTGTGTSNGPVKRMELLRKPSLVRKWAVQAAEAPRSAASRRRHSTPRSVSSSLPPVNDDEESVQGGSASPHPSLVVNTGQSGLGLGALGFGPSGELSSQTCSVVEEDDFDPDVGKDHEAALAQLTANSRQNSPVVAKSPELEDIRSAMANSADRGSPRPSLRGSLRSAGHTSLGNITALSSSIPLPPSPHSEPRGSPQLKSSPLHQRVLELAHEGDDAPPVQTPPSPTPVRAFPDTHTHTPSEAGSAVSGTSFVSAHSGEMSPEASSTIKGSPQLGSPQGSPRSTTAVSLSAMSSESWTPSTADGWIAMSDLIPLRHLLDNATSARECQLLLDAILSQLGVPRTPFGGTVARPEDRVAAWLLAGCEGPVGDFRLAHHRHRKPSASQRDSARSKRSKRSISRLSPEVTMKNLPALPPSNFSPAAEDTDADESVTVQGTAEDVNVKAKDVDVDVADTAAEAVEVVDLGLSTSLSTSPVTAPMSPIAPRGADIDAEAEAVASIAAEDRLAHRVSTLVTA